MKSLLSFALCAMVLLDGCILGNGGGGSGTGWTTQSSGTVTVLRSVQFVNTTTGWAVGDEEVTLKTTDGGATWVNKSPGTWSRSKSHAVRFMDLNLGWMLSDSDGVAYIFKTTDGGESWNKYRLSSDMNSIFFADAYTGWVVGSDYMSKTTNGGVTWQTPTNISGSIELTSVTFADVMNGWVVGDRGDIFKTTNGGTTWNRQTSGTTRDLNAVCTLKRYGEMDYEAHWKFFLPEESLNLVPADWPKARSVVRTELLDRCRICAR